jgi:hypothetical protein
VNDLRKLLKLLIPILPVLFSLQMVKAQVPGKMRSALSTGGSSVTILANGQQYYLQQSIGQSGIIGLIQNSNIQLRQGFIQPLEGSVKTVSSGTLQATIFPNPFSEHIIVSLYEETPDLLFVTIYDLNGKIVYLKKLETPQELILDTSPLPPGIYFIRISTTTKYLNSKLIKL